MVRTYLRRVVTYQPPLRLAIVADLAKTVAEPDLAEALSEMVGPNIFPPNASDAIFQYNIRSALKSYPELAINRLCTWMSGQVGYMETNIAQPPFQRQSFIMTQFVGLKIDVNTMNQSSVLPANLIGGIIDEIAAEARALRIEGRLRLV
jgi:hypothetical protein